MEPVLNRHALLGFSGKRSHCLLLQVAVARMLQATAVIHGKGNAQKDVRSCTAFCAREFKTFCLKRKTESLTRWVRYGSFKTLSVSLFPVYDHHNNGLRDCSYYGYDFDC